MVYLLCFDKKFKHAKHYIGFAENQRTFEARMKHHAKGQGSRLMAAVAKAGIGFCVSRTWPDGDRNFERKLKNRKEASALCPHCKTALAERKKRRRVLANEAKVIEKLNAPPIVCPVVETAKQLDIDQVLLETVKRLDLAEGKVPMTMEPAGPSVTELLTKAKEVYAESQGDTLRSRWARIWSRVARLWLVLKDKLVSK